MCGIVGAVDRRDITSMLTEGLRRLEYRGYDSCGIAVVQQGALRRVRSVARVANLAAEVAEARLSGMIGIAHTRWATHGAPVARNAHPIFSSDEIAIVHNGIIENHESLREELEALGYVFESDTDTEVVAHLIHQMWQRQPAQGADNLLSAVRHALDRLHGAYAIAVFARNDPGRVIGARAGSPLVVGLGEHGNYLASDVMALAGTVENFIYLEEGDIAELTLHGAQIFDRSGKQVEREVKVHRSSTGAVELGPYRHYMHKEIFEQPSAIADAIETVHTVTADLFGQGARHAFREIDSVLVIACGTSYYAGMTARYWLESLAKVPTQVEVASEYRYRSSVHNPNTLVVVVSQSGETADTLAALRHAQSHGHRHTLAICNVASSTMMRQAELQYLTSAGPEIGVASTKAFTSQLVALFLLALTLGKQRGRLTAAQESEFLEQLHRLPGKLNSVLALETQIVAWAETFARTDHALFLGRGLHYPIALEGALKLKEISYVHAEAYPAGELKHGPLALVTSQMPVVTVAPNDALLDKLKSNMQEVRARSGQLYVFADVDSRIAEADGLHVIRMPEHYGSLSPVLHVVPLQLLAYHTACARGTDVDKPRNLAKSVTVE
ncbi:glutamine--fructose-6-phosphate transaminase (isomerizing) [Paraburkholderia phenoliruptrix]|uniref:glutamine--fructose-6-phosphate transaminase (isomerizing) n=1 Tax=Paraburkholderia phenoliruptrix TaxID=252970 RepID=UPI001C4F258F|nr:glutamine--fructose-6-phosphate transaminase (isomerizing) [Paraburkholderia phenoliruptrix]MBW0445057.1 glutamine--fructose-6-phosphate transaminase (isomerizing) [Paraburkholderia phenoliruptrix]MBW9095822.1 glutamine--fructose-6-phosphate transaminase (isomerizing) [Paraburkholderia phenoliruptrix]